MDGRKTKEKASETVGRLVKGGEKAGRALCFLLWGIVRLRSA